MPASAAAYQAVGTLYNALMTALVLSLVTRRGEVTARDYVFRHFRRQHLEKFLPGLQKLGLADEAAAFASARGVAVVWGKHSQYACDIRFDGDRVAVAMVTALD